MKRTSYEEVADALMKLHNLASIFSPEGPLQIEIKEMFYKANTFMWYHKPPTFEELQGKWYSTEGLQIRECSEYIEIYSKWSKISYYKVYRDTNNVRVWINQNYNALTNQQMELINLTIRYLEARKD